MKLDHLITVSSTCINKVSLTYIPSAKKSNGGPPFQQSFLWGGMSEASEKHWLNPIFGGYFMYVGWGGGVAKLP